MYIYIYIYTSLSIYIYMYYTYVCIHIYIYIYIHTLGDARGEAEADSAVLGRAAPARGDEDQNYQIQNTTDNM